jgi:hypothetical protein
MILVLVAQRLLAARITLVCHQWDLARLVYDETYRHIHVYIYIVALTVQIVHMPAYVQAWALKVSDLRPPPILGLC